MYRMDSPRRFARTLTTMSCSVLVYACGGGVDLAQAPAPGAPPPLAGLALNTSNYQGALSFALESANAGFGFAKLGADVADRLFNASLVPSPILACRVSGNATVELTDRNRNGMLNVDDTLHIFMSSCNSSTSALTGALRIEIASATDIPGGREYLFTVTCDLTVASTVAGVAPVNINFAGTVHFTRAIDFDHYVLSFGDYEYASAGQTRFATDLLVDYLQRYDTLRYDYFARATVGGSTIQGQYQMSTPLALSGPIGVFPDTGQLVLAGDANSTARLSEEGDAAMNAETVMIAVDSNGDGTPEASVPEFPWAALSAQATFASLREQPAIVALPVP